MVSLMFSSTWRITVLSHVVDRTCDIPELILRGYCVSNFRHWSEVVSTICFWFGNSDELDLFKREGVKSFRFKFLALKRSLSCSHSWMTPWAFCSLLHPFIRGSALSASSWLETSSGSRAWVRWAASTPCVRSAWINTRGTVLLGDAYFLVSVGCTSRTLYIWVNPRAYPPDTHTHSHHQMAFSEVAEDTNVAGNRMREKKRRVRVAPWEQGLYRYCECFLSKLFIQIWFLMM